MGNSSSSSSSGPSSSQPQAANNQAGPSGPLQQYPPPRAYAPPQVNQGGSHMAAYQAQTQGGYPGPGQGPLVPRPVSQQPRVPVPLPQELTTQTLRNQVNLKKDSIRVQPVAGSPGQLAIAFRFDATAPCRVTVFVNAKDGKARNSLEYQGDAIGVTHYDKGIDQAFPQAGTSTTVDAAVAARWASMPDGSYALAIRLEALTDEGRAEGHSIEFVEAGGELPTWVQSQTTYVQLVHSDSGVWLASHVLQKLWINGSTFELQEIYGLEPSRGQAATAGEDGVVDGVVEDDGSNECVICMSAPRDTMSLPCRHMCMCHSCADELKVQTNKCPICRNVVTSLLHIKIGRGGKAAESSTAAPAQ